MNLKGLFPEHLVTNVAFRDQRHIEDTHKIQGPALCDIS